MGQNQVERYPLFRGFFRLFSPTKPFTYVSCLIMYQLHSCKKSIMCEKQRGERLTNRPASAKGYSGVSYESGSSVETQGGTAGQSNKHTLQHLATFMTTPPDSNIIPKLCTMHSDRQMQKLCQYYDTYLQSIETVGRG